jgi:hypothetical protein
VIGSRCLYRVTALARAFCACWPNRAGRLRAQSRRRIWSGIPRPWPNLDLKEVFYDCANLHKENARLGAVTPGGPMVELCARSTHNIHQSLAGVKRFSQNACKISPFSLPKQLCLLIPCPWHHESWNSHHVVPGPGNEDKARLWAVFHFPLVPSRSPHQRM